jgi:hypothetical protein
MSHLRPLIFASALATIAGCSVAPANVTGTYTTNLTNGANGCMFSNWTEGNVTSGIPIMLTQSGTAVTGTVMGAAATYLDVLLGSHVFVGNVSGHELDLVLHGSRSATTGGCTAMANAEIHGTLVGDTLTGTITYSAVTNHDPSCGYLETCTSTQSFNGVRPPM